MVQIKELFIIIFFLRINRIYLINNINNKELIINNKIINKKNKAF